MKRALILIALATLTGCASICKRLPCNRPEPTPPPSEFPAGLVWLHADVSGWPATATLNASVSGATIILDYNKARVWPGREHVGAFVNANPWVIVQHKGQWYAATWEWLRFGQTSKAAAALEPGHIKRRELDDWMPVSGERYGFMVSGLARDHVRNVSERSNVSWVVWP